MVRIPGGDFDWTESAFLFSASWRIRHWNPLIEVGVTAKLLDRSLLGMVTKMATGFDFGARFRWWDFPLALGLQCQNLNEPRLGSDAFPRSYSLGLSWLFRKFKPTVLNFDVVRVDGRKDRYWDFRMGLDYKITDFSSIRLGVNPGSEKFTLGIGIRWKGFELDGSAGRSSGDLGFGSFVPRSALSFHGKNDFSAMLDRAKSLWADDFSKNEKKIKHLIYQVQEQTDEPEEAIAAMVLLGDLAYEKNDFKLALNNYWKAITWKGESNKNFKPLDIQAVGKSKEPSYIKYLECLIREFYPMALAKYICKNPVPNLDTKKYLNNPISGEGFPFEKKDIIGERIFKRELVKFMQNLAKEASRPADFRANKDAFRNLLDTYSTDPDIKEMIRFNYLLSLWESGDSSAVDGLIMFVDKDALPNLPDYLGIDKQKVEKVVWNVLAKDYQKFRTRFSAIAFNRVKARLYEPENNKLKLIDKHFKDISKLVIAKTEDKNSFLPDSLPDLNFKQIITSRDSFNLPWQIIRGNANDFYLSEFGNDSISHLDSNLGLLQKYSTEYVGPAGLVAFNSSGSGLVGLVAFPKQTKIKYGKFSNLQPFFSGASVVLNQAKSKKEITFSYPTGFQLYRNSLLYVLDSGNKRFIEYSISPGEEFCGFMENSDFSIRVGPDCSFGWPVSFDFHPQKNEIFVADLESRKVLKGIFQHSWLLTNNFLVPAKDNYFWFPVWIQTTLEDVDKAYVYVIFRAEPAGQQNLLVKYDTTGQPVAKRWIDKSVLSCLIESSGQRTILYLPERVSNGRILQYQLRGD